MIFNSFIPSDEYKSSTINIRNMKAGTDVDFSSREACIEVDNLNDKKIYDKQLGDIIIEMIAFKPNGEIECTLATFCKLIPENKNDKTVYKIKCEMQKLKVKNYWFEMHDIYGFTTDQTECEICCSNKRNTIFLPCKHSYACSICAVNIRLRGNNCPICRLSNIYIFI